MAKPAVDRRARERSLPAGSDAVIAAVLAWSEDTIEQPHPVFGGLPICPFARAARLRETIQFRVMPFALDDPLERTGYLITLIDRFAADSQWETLFVIHPDAEAVEVWALESFVARLGRRLSTIPPLLNLRVFEAHPASLFCVGGVYTRRAPYPSFQILSHEKLKESSDALLSSRYYDDFTPEMLAAVGMPRT